MLERKQSMNFKRFKTSAALFATALLATAGIVPAAYAGISDAEDGVATRHAKP